MCVRRGNLLYSQAALLVRRENMRYLLLVNFFLANDAELLKHLQKTVHRLFRIRPHTIFPHTLHKVTMEFPSFKGFPVRHTLVCSLCPKDLRFHDDYVLEKVDEPLMTEYHQLVQFRRRIVMQDHVVIMEEVYHSFQVVVGDVPMLAYHLVYSFQIRELCGIVCLQEPQITFTFEPSKREKKTVWSQPACIGSRVKRQIDKCRTLANVTLPTMTADVYFSDLATAPRPPPPFTSDPPPLLKFLQCREKGTEC